VVTANGNFNFANTFPTNSNYAVSVNSTPAGYNCSVRNGFGTVSNSNINNISIVCSTIQSFYYLNGKISGLDANQSITLVNGQDDAIVVSTNGSFSFAIPLQAGTNYSVKIRGDNLPSFKKCIVKNGDGILQNNSTDVSVECLTPMVSTIAGRANYPGYFNGTGAAAYFNAPEGVAVDELGNIFVADTGNNLIRKITPAGYVTTLAGNGVRNVKDGKGVEASFDRPNAIAVDKLGNVYVCDSSSIRVISTDATVKTISGMSCFGIAVNSAGNLFASSREYINILKKEEVGYTRTKSIPYPSYVTRWSNYRNYNRIYGGITNDGHGNVYIVTNDGVKKISDDGSIADTLIRSNLDTNWDSRSMPVNIAIDSNGYLYGTIGNPDYYYDQLGIKQIYPNGSDSFFSNYGAGNDNGKIQAAKFSDPRGISIDTMNNIYIADKDNHMIRKISFVNQ
jgi:hypothetical protein